MHDGVTSPPWICSPERSHSPTRDDGLPIRSSSRGHVHSPPTRHDAQQIPGKFTTSRLRLLFGSGSNLMVTCCGYPTVLISVVCSRLRSLRVRDSATYATQIKGGGSDIEGRSSLECGPSGYISRFSRTRDIFGREHHKWGVRMTCGHCALIYGGLPLSKTVKRTDRLHRLSNKLRGETF